MKVSVNVLFQNWYFLGVKKFQATPTRQDFGTYWSRGKNDSRMNDWIRNRIILFYSIYKEDT